MILTLDTIYRDVLEGLANRDQNQYYPPHIRDQHMNFITHALIDELVKLYPTNNSVISILQPFMKSVELNVKNGEVEFPLDYRNFLSMGVYVRDEDDQSKKNKISPCTSSGYKLCELDSKDDPMTPSIEVLKKRALARTCRSNPVDEKTVNDWDIATGHPYKKPTIEDPICCIFSGRGITICPHDVEQVVLRYVRHPKQYKFGYTILPDDTIQWDANSTEESEWLTTARQYINKGMNTLYSIFARDGEMKEGNMEIKKMSFF